MKERVAGPKFLVPSGELAKRVTPYLEEVGVKAIHGNKRSLGAMTNVGIALVQVRPTDLPNILRLGLPDVIGGIAGSDSFLEETGELYPGIEIAVYDDEERKPRISIAVSKTFIKEQGGSTSLEDLRGKIVTTTLPNMTKDIFQETGIETVTFPETTEEKENTNTVTIFPVGGKTEALSLLSYRTPAVVDVVDSGDTLAANGLEVIKDIHEVSVRLVVASEINEENLEAFTRLEERIRGGT